MQPSYKKRVGWVIFIRPEADKCFGKTLTWLKLSNSGDSLKTIIPNYNRKFVSGWSNYSCKVTSYSMNESEIGYRGSKSELKFSVKEQRVDGSYCIKAKSKIMQLRCTLMGFERNYQIKYPSKQLGAVARYYSTDTYLNDSFLDTKLNPWFITGFSDAESTFTIVIDKNKNRILGWRVQSKFQIGLHKRDLSLLLQIKQFFNNIGSIGKSGDMVYYSVSKIDDLINIIIPHFSNYPLITQKAADFLLFKKVVYLIKNKEHLTNEGFKKITEIKSFMNIWIQSENKKKSNIQIEQIKSIKGKELRPIINTNSIPHPFWITGFVSGEGTFDVKIYKSKTIIGYAVQLRFRIPQHERDKKLMELLIKYFDSGLIENHSKFPAVSLVIVKFTNIVEKIIPFFDKYPIQGEKLNDYLDWCKIARLIKNKSHLTNEGLISIKNIKKGMNNSRLNKD